MIKKVSGFKAFFSKVFHGKKSKEKKLSESDQKISSQSPKIKGHQANKGLKKPLAKKDSVGSEDKKAESLYQKIINKFTKAKINPSEHALDILKQLLPSILEKEEGLFRISGNQEKINDAISTIKEGKPLTLNKLDIHEKTGIIKKLFDPENKLLQIHTVFNLEDENLIHLDEIKKSIEKLEEPHQEALKLLLQTLKEISSMPEVKMPADNLGRIFGTKLMPPGLEMEKELQLTGPANKLASYLVQNAGTFAPKTN